MMYIKPSKQIAHFAHFFCYFYDRLGLYFLALSIFEFLLQSFKKKSLLLIH